MRNAVHVLITALAGIVSPLAAQAPPKFHTCQDAPELLRCGQLAKVSATTAKAIWSDLDNARYQEARARYFGALGTIGYLDLVVVVHGDNVDQALLSDDGAPGFISHGVVEGQQYIWVLVFSDRDLKKLPPVGDGLDEASRFVADSMVRQLLSLPRDTNLDTLLPKDTKQYREAFQSLVSGKGWNNRDHEAFLAAAAHRRTRGIVAAGKYCSGAQVQCQVPLRLSGQDASELKGSGEMGGALRLKRTTIRTAGEPALRRFLSAILDRLGSGSSDQTTLVTDDSLTMALRKVSEGEPPLFVGMARFAIPTDATYRFDLTASEGHELPGVQGAFRSVVNRGNSRISVAVSPAFVFASGKLFNQRIGAAERRFDPGLDTTVVYDTRDSSGTILRADSTKVFTVRRRHSELDVVALVQLHLRLFRLSPTSGALRSSNQASLIRPPEVALAFGTNVGLGSIFDHLVLGLALKNLLVQDFGISAGIDWRQVEKNQCVSKAANETPVRTVCQQASGVYFKEILRDRGRAARIFTGMTIAF